VRGAAGALDSGAGLPLGGGGNVDCHLPLIVLADQATGKERDIERYDLIPLREEVGDRSYPVQVPDRVIQVSSKATQNEIDMLSPPRLGGDVDNGGGVKQTGAQAS